jgi:hypothetical protein
MRRARAPWASVVTVMGLAAGCALGGCEAILGTGSLGDRPAGEGGAGDGTIGAESGPDALSSETGSDSATDATAKDGGPDGTAADAADATSGDAGDATGGDAGDATTVETGPSESGTEAGVEAGPEAAPEAAPTLSCGMVGADQRQINAAGATVSADGLAVFNASQTNVIAVVKTGSPPALAYQIRSDRPGDAPNLVPLQSTAASPANLLGVTRTVGGTATYVLGGDNAGETLFWNWPDSSNIGAAPTATATPSPGLGAGQMVATSQGVFYALTDNSGAYADFQVPPALPTIVASNQITTVPNGMSDGARAFRLSDDRVSLVYIAADGTSHQNEYAANSATLSSSRLYYSDGMIPYSFQPDGANVDVSAVLFPADAAGVEIGTGVVPESQLFSFDPGSALKVVTLPDQPSNTWCVTSYPGKLVFLAPTTAGMDLLIIDVATGTLAYSLTGASNLVHADSAIVGCAIAQPVIAGSTMTFEVIWTDNTGTGSQNLEFAPLQCTLQ